jgi:hypothetical protein
MADKGYSRLPRHLCGLFINKYPHMIVLKPIMKPLIPQIASYGEIMNLIVSKYGFLVLSGILM